MRGLRLLVEDVDVVRVQDVGLRMATDQAILDWAATEGRILVTQDIRTMPDFAYDRVNAGLAMPGVAVLGRLPPAPLIGGQTRSERDSLITRVSLVGALVMAREFADTGARTHLDEAACPDVRVMSGSPPMRDRWGLRQAEWHGATVPDQVSNGRVHHGTG